MTRVGCVATLHADGLAFQVRILEERNAYGHDRCLVQPVAGEGSRWVNAARLTFTEGDTP